MPSRMLAIAWSITTTDAIDAPQEVAVVLVALERLDAVARPELREEARQAEHLVDRQQMEGKAAPLDRLVALVDEDVVAQPVLAGEQLAVDLLDLRQPAALEPLGVVLRLLAQEIGQQVVVARVADRGGLDRAALQALLEVVLEELMEPGCLDSAGIASSGLGLRLGAGGAGHQAKGREQGKSLRSHHPVVPPGAVA